MNITIHYTLTPTTRISAGRAGEVQNNRQVHQVLPGTVVWGALGGAWWRRDDGFPSSDNAQQLFDQTFHEHIEVGPAIPRLAASKDAGTAAEELTSTFRPLSWVRCKYPTEDCPPGWHDQMLDIYGGLDGAAAKTCPTCTRPWESAKGWDVPEQFSTGITRTALSGGTAVTSQLFTRQALRTATTDGDRRIVLKGTIQLSDSTPDVLAWFTSARTLRIGGQLSTMGECSWTAEALHDEPSLPQSRHGAMSVRLVTPAILLDRYGAASLDLAASLRTAIAASSGSGKVGRTWTRPDVVSGWNGLAGLPKPEEWAVAAGSCALVTDCDEATLRTLLAGLGVRRTEGYGRMVVVPIECANRRIDPDRLTDADLGLTEDAASPTGIAGPAGSTGAAPATPATPLTILLQSLQGLPLRDATLAGLRHAAATSHRLRSRGFPSGVVKGQIEKTADLPWMRDLPHETAEKVTDVLNMADLGLVVAVIDQERGGANQ